MTALPAPTGIPIDQIIAGFAAVHLTGPDTVTFAREVLAGLRQYGLDPDENRIAAEQAAAESAVLRTRVASLEAEIGDARQDALGWKAEFERAKVRVDAHEGSTRLLEHMAQPHIVSQPPNLGTLLEQVKAARATDPVEPSGG